MNPIAARLLAISRSTAFLWICLSLIFLKTIWGIWEYRDLTPGDTTYYFKTAVKFAQNGSNSFPWSPTYTSFLGTLLLLLKDPYLAIIWHRIIILTLIILLAFEIGRHLNKPNIAFLVATWWAILPINHDALYEVHLFAVVPLLFATYISLKFPGFWGRALTLAIFVHITLVVRNEYLLATGLLGICCLIADFIIPFRRDFTTIKWKVFAPARVYLLCIGISLLTALAIFQLSYIKGEKLRSHIKEKHTLNVSQIVSYNHLQRMGDNSFSPWTGYHEYMTSRFGKPQLSMSEAFRANPPEMLSHFTWNFSLIPSGLQLALFNQRAGQYDPDYVTSVRNDMVANFLSILLITMWILGIYSAFTLKDPNKFAFLRERLWTWIPLFTFFATTCVVIIMQRPRPSYMFTFTFILMTITGIALHFTLRRFQLEKNFDRVFPILAVILVCVVPAYWLDKGKLQNLRPTLAQVRLLKKAKLPYNKDEIIGAFEYGTEAGVYANTPYPIVDVRTYLPSDDDFTKFVTQLEQNKVRYIMASGPQRYYYIVSKQLDDPPYSWKVLSTIKEQKEKYYLYDTKPQTPAP